MPGSAQSPTRSLEARYYTDAEIYAKELRGVLARTWQFACHGAEIPDAGDYIAFQIAGENLFIIRGRDGVARSFYNVCQHRAHELVAGRGNTRLVVCPYHAWTYELTGQMRGGPNVNAVPGFNRQEICLTQVRTEDFNGFLFVNLDPDAAPMDEWFPGVRSEVQDFVPNIAELAPLTYVEVSERCNWKVSVENYSECYHCSLNHPTFATGVIRPETYDIQPQQGYVLRHTTEASDLSQMSYPVDLSANARAGAYRSWFLWPMVSFQVYPGNVLNTYHWRNTGPDTVKVYRGWYTPGGEDSEVIRKLAEQDRDTTLAEDIRLVESVQRGLNSRGYRPGPLVLDPACGLNSEHSIETLQRWMREAVDGETL